MPDIFTPPKPPSVSGFQIKEEPKVNRIEFEGGYSQRSVTGPNHTPNKGKLTWNKLTEAQRDALLSFFRAKGGAEAFLYQLPGESETRLWTASQWSRSPDKNKIHWSMNVTFTEEFDIY